MSLNSQEDKRVTARRRVYKSAHICLNGLRVTIDCLVRNYSDTGARLIVETSLGIPESFDLVREGVPTRQRRVVWRHASEIGVVFV